MKKQRILFVCGPDRTRKSSIIKLLASDKLPSFKASDEHLTFMNRSSDRFLMNLVYSDVRMLDFLKQTKHSIIFYRGYPCEFVYSDFFNRKTNTSTLKYLDDEYAKLGAKILLCTRRSFEGITDDLDKNINEEALVKLSSLYDEFSTWTQCQVMKVFVDEKKKRDIVKEVRAWLKQ